MMNEDRARLAQLIQDGPDRDQQQEVVELVSRVHVEDLNHTLEHLGAEDVLDSVANRWFGANLRDELLEVLTVHRIHELRIPALVGLVTWLQVGWTRGKDERALRNILLSRRGRELTHLKNKINLHKGRHDLEGLVYADVGDEELRAEMLAHFAAEATAVPGREVKVLSDIDDTALARIHEERYPKGTVIPGVLAFYEALDVGPEESPRSRGDLTFVTARPSDAMGLMKGQSRRTLTDAGMTELSIMTGSWFKIATKKSMASEKVANIAHYAELFPEYDLVFIGDSGQGDIGVAQQILAEHSEVVRACFIHDVVAMPDQERQELAGQGIWVVDTYIGAAGKARELGLISDARVQDVIAETRAALDEIEWESAEQERRVRDLVERDAATV